MTELIKIEVLNTETKMNESFTLSKVCNCNLSINLESAMNFIAIHGQDKFYNLIGKEVGKLWTDKS